LRLIILLREGEDYRKRNCHVLGEGYLLMGNGRKSEKQNGEKTYIRKMQCHHREKYGLANIISQRKMNEEAVLVWEREREGERERIS
jgi:hypothetical protein